MTPAAILLGAADLIEERGLSQGAFARTKKGHSVPPGAGAAYSFCMSSALDRIVAAAGGGPKNRAALAEAHARLNGFILEEGRRAGGSEPLSTFGYNDAPGRTRAQAADKLRQAARWAV